MLATAHECCFPASVAEDAVVSDFDEAFREDVEEEALDERRGRERHLVGAIGVCRVTVTEGDLISLDEGGG